jgi:amino acid transporter
MALGAALPIAIYDFLGYYDICFLGDEVRDPARTIPKAVVISVLAVAAIYATMNIGVLGALPLEQIEKSPVVFARCSRWPGEAGRRRSSPA